MSIHPKRTIEFKREAASGNWRIYMRERGLDVPIGLIEKTFTGWKSRPTEHLSPYFDPSVLFDQHWNLNDLKFEIRMQVGASMKEKGAQ